MRIKTNIYTFLVQHVSYLMKTDQKISLLRLKPKIDWKVLFFHDQCEQSLQNNEEEEMKLLQNKQLTGLK
jgi:hypothetical protein